MSSKGRAMIYETVRRAPGYEFRVRSDLPSAPFVLGRLLAAFPEVSGGPGIPTYTLARYEHDGKRFALDLDGSSIQKVEQAGSMIDWLVSDLTSKVVERAAGFVAVHAGVVASTGRAIVLPAAPDSGKTTCVAGLTSAGFSYLSEEVALFDLETGLVHPFPRPLVMEQGSLQVLEGLMARLPAEYEEFRRRLYHVAPDDLRPGAVGVPSPVGFVVAPRYRMRATTRLTPMTRAETLFVLARNSFNLADARSAGFSALGRIAASAAGYRLDIGDLRTAVGAVTELVRRGPEPSEDAGG